MFERDPEELGNESYEDIELRMDVQDSIHTFDPGPDGRCRAHLIRHGAQGNVCGSTQRSSVFHDDPDAAFREAHWHGGGDCMCFENDDWGEDQPLVPMNRYTVVLQLDVMSTEKHPQDWDWVTLLDLAKSEGEDVRVLAAVSE